MQWEAMSKLHGCLGIKTSKVIIIAYIISGFLCGLGAILMTSKLMSASSTMISNTEMDAIARQCWAGPVCQAAWALYLALLSALSLLP